jgi:hypothetical protein
MILRVIFSITLLFVSVVNAGQDPMRPPNWINQVQSTPVESTKINLQQILISANRKVVIINDRIFREGQSIGGNKIIEIDATQIKIRRGGVSKIIKLLPSTKGESSEI